MKYLVLRCHECGSELQMCGGGDWGWCFVCNPPIAWNMFQKDEDRLAIDPVEKRNDS